MPFVPSSFLFLVAMPFVPSSFLLRHNFFWPVRAWPLESNLESESWETIAAGLPLGPSPRGRLHREDLEPSGATDGALLAPYL